MKRTILSGRTTKDVTVRYTQGEKSMAIANTSIAVDSGYGDKKRTDFFNIVAFGKTAETFEKHVPKGTKILVECEPAQVQYTDKNGNKVNTVQFNVNSFEFCEHKSQGKTDASDDGFMSVPVGVEDEGLPFA